MADANSDVESIPMGDEDSIPSLTASDEDAVICFFHVYCILYAHRFIGSDSGLLRFC